MALPPELQVQQPQVPEQGQQSVSPIADQMEVTVQDGVGDFLTTLIRLVESKGLNLDDIMAENSVEDEADLADPSGIDDITEFLTEEELVLLVQKFEALEPDAKKHLEQEFLDKLDPKLIQRLRGVQRFVQGRKQ